MTKEEYIKIYKLVLKVKGLSFRTIETYTDRLNSFLCWCEKEDIYPPQITKKQLLNYLCSIKSNSYLRQQRGTIDNFYKYVLEMPYILNGMPYPKKQKSLPDYFSPSELLAIFNYVKNDKQRLMLKIQYACALRVHELVKLKWSDFINNFGKYDLKICGKGSKPDIVPVPNETINEIISILGDKFGINEYLFAGQFKEHYSERSVQEVINRAMLQLNIHKTGSTHLLRHSRATHLIQSGVSLRHVQILLRHNSSRTTETYTHLNTIDLRGAFDKADTIISGLLNNQKQFTHT